MNNYGFEVTIQVHDKITFEEALLRVEDKSKITKIQLEKK